MKRPAKSGAKKTARSDTVGDLAEYNRKRDFKKTSEPAGGKAAAAEAKPAAKRPKAAAEKVRAPSRAKAPAKRAKK